MRHIALAAALLVALTACSGNDSDSLPTATATPSAASTSPSPEVAAAPTPPELSEEEQQQVDVAFKDFDAADEMISELQLEPVKASADQKKLAAQLTEFYFAPAFNNQARALRLMSEAGTHMEGSTKRHWRVTRKVSLDSQPPVVVFRECTTVGDFKVVRENGEEVPQPGLTLPRLYETTMNPWWDGQKIGGWRITKTEDVGSCAA